jgi:hypothetical protein
LHFRTTPPANRNDIISKRGTRCASSRRHFSACCWAAHGPPAHSCLRRTQPASAPGTWFFFGTTPRGSKGAALDHIGFEVADMDAFAAHLASLGIAFDVPRRIDAIGLTIAFLTDPAGTYIEVTEGLAAVK